MKNNKCFSLFFFLLSMILSSASFSSDQSVPSDELAHIRKGLALIGMGGIASLSDELLEKMMLEAEPHFYHKEFFEGVGNCLAFAGLYEVSTATASLYSKWRNRNSGFKGGVVDLCSAFSLSAGLHYISPYLSDSLGATGFKQVVIAVTLFQFMRGSGNFVVNLIDYAQKIGQEHDHDKLL